MPIDSPPFWGYPLRPGITFTYLGLKVDERARVLMNDGCAAANVFAAGEIMAGNILGRGYVAGAGMAIGTVFGRIAGTEAGPACRFDEVLREGERVMTVCNACRYCEGYCPVFPAMEQQVAVRARRPDLPRQSLSQLRRVPVRLPVRAAARVRRSTCRTTLARIRLLSYEEYSWPKAAGAAFRHHGVATTLAVIALLTGVLARADDAVRRAASSGPRARTAISTASCRTP